MKRNSDFIKGIKALPKVIPSITGKAAYSGFYLNGNILNFYRVVPKTNWKLDIEILWEVYINNSFINTAVVRKMTGGRVNSPSVAILRAIKCIDDQGNRI